MTGDVRFSVTRRGFLLGGVSLPFAPLFQTTARPTRPAVILLWMNGGPSQLETFAPEHGISQFPVLATDIPGFGMCALMPRLARRAHLLAVLRDMATPEACHQRAWHFAHTGIRLPLTEAPKPRPEPILMKLRREFPDAFDLSREDQATLRAYGDTGFGKECLIARRLVERGASFIEVELDGWDVHCDAAARLPGLLATLDRAFSALLDDLVRGGLLDTTRVIWMGEFGRTREVNRFGGRDHDPRRGCVVLAGAGIGGGTVRSALHEAMPMDWGAAPRLARLSATAQTP